MELPAPTGMQPQTEDLRDFANSKGKDITSSPELSTTTAVFCSGLASMCWSNSCSAPGTGLQAELASQPHRSQCHQRDKKKGGLLCSPETPHIKKEREKTGWLLDYRGSIQKAGLGTLVIHSSAISCLLR